MATQVSEHAISAIVSLAKNPNANLFPAQSQALTTAAQSEELSAEVVQHALKRIMAENAGPNEAANAVMDPRSGRLTELTELPVTETQLKNILAAIEQRKLFHLAFRQHAPRLIENMQNAGVHFHGNALDHFAALKSRRPLAAVRTITATRRPEPATPGPHEPHREGNLPQGFRPRGQAAQPGKKPFWQIIMAKFRRK